MTGDALLEFLRECPAAPATLTKRVRVIHHMHLALGYAPLDFPARVRDVLRGRPARPVRGMFSVEQVEEALRELPSHGWTAGWFGRRDRALLVLSQLAGLPYRQLARLTPADLTFRPNGTAVIATQTGTHQLEPDADPVVCGPCALVRWVHALDWAVTFRRFKQQLDRAQPITPASPHQCTHPRPLADRTWTVGLLPPTDQWGSTALKPAPLTPRSLSELARRHSAGEHPLHRIIPIEPAEPEPVGAPAVLPAPYTVADRNAALRRQAEARTHLDGIDELLDDLDRRATELERRLRSLLS